jgi:hypothetical protein
MKMMDTDMDTVDIHMDISLDTDMIIVMKTGNEHGADTHRCLNISRPSGTFCKDPSVPISSIDMPDSTRFSPISGGSDIMLSPI